MDLPIQTIEAGTPKRKPLKSLAGELEDSVLKLCRHPRYGSTLGKAKAYIVKKLQEYGYEVYLQEFFNMHGRFYNIIAERKGTAPGRYIIGAHYDVCSPEGEDTDGYVFPGADDNGSAVAVLLAVAKRLPKRPKRTVEMVFYACEEPPFFSEKGAMGSWHHANSCDPKEVIGMIALDMLGVYGDNAVAPDSPPWAKALKPLLPGHGNFLTVCGAADSDTVNLAKTAQYFISDYMCAVRVNMPRVGIPGTEIGTNRLFDSDHRNYVPLDIPAIMITDTAQIRNTNYHTDADTPDTLDYTMMAKATWAVLDILKYVAW